MAATAYASLVSLLNTLDAIHTHPLVSTFFDINQNKSLSEKVDFLVDFVEKYSDAESGEVEDLVRRLADAAHEAEDMIEVYAADRVRGLGERLSLLPDLQMIIEEMELIKEEVIKVKEETEKKAKEAIQVMEEAGKSRSVLPDPPPSSSSSAPPATAEATTMVGFEDYVDQLWDDLIGHDDRKIISITGMGGIGKTTLARNLYENLNTKCHFNVRVWVTVSQDCSARKVFLQALSSLGGGSMDVDTADDQQLSDELYKTLYNRRYLIILDDVWSVEIWDKTKFFFPENYNGSRIVVTTRESRLFSYIGSSSLALKFLSEENSWKLFCENTFPQQDFPSGLEEVGKKIVKKCGGLPLAIIVIGGLLGKSPNTHEYWEKVANDKSLILNSGDNKSSSILYLSYKYLPVWLKPCFLYLGLYPEDFDIYINTLIQLWVAEGFIISSRGQSLEGVAKSYLRELVDRNLLLFRDTIHLSIHDLVRDLCIKIGEKEKFYCVQRSIDGNHHFIADQTTTRFYSQESHAYKTPSILHPLIVPAGKIAAPFKTRLLRVLYYDDGSPYYDVCQEVNIRFLFSYSIKVDYLLPSLLPRFWCLQTLISSLSKEVVVQAEIWKMPQLRHISIPRICLPNPPPTSDDEVSILQNLQTIRVVENLILTEEVCKRIPNITDLCINYEFHPQSEAWPCYHLQNLGKLECLVYHCKVPEYYAGGLLHNINFPISLKELKLDGCRMEWSYMAVIASLPHLQQLSIQCDAVASTEWIFVDEKFVSLKGLSFIFCRRVTKWIAQSSNFPVLERLSIWSFPELDEIPSGIGEIPTLRSIYLRGCSESAYISAVEILQEQQRFENLGLRVQIRALKAELLREKIQELGFTCQNLVINSEPYQPQLRVNDAGNQKLLIWIWKVALASGWPLFSKQNPSLPIKRLAAIISLLYKDIYGHVTEWIAESSNFPVLEKLHIWDLSILNETDPLEKYRRSKKFICPSAAHQPRFQQLRYYTNKRGLKISAFKLISRLEKRKQNRVQ